MKLATAIAHKDVDVDRFDFFCEHAKFFARLSIVIV